MNGLTNEITLARTVALRAVHAYLCTHGWLRADDSDWATADVYLSLQDEREAAIVPASEEYADYGIPIYQIAEQIGRIEGRQRLAVLSDLSPLRPQADLVEPTPVHRVDPGEAPLQALEARALVALDRMCSSTR